jgi:hypothetical protein
MPGIGFDGGKNDKKRQANNRCKGSSHMGEGIDRLPEYFYTGFHNSIYTAYLLSCIGLFSIITFLLPEQKLENNTYSDKLLEKKS